MSDYQQTPSQTVGPYFAYGLSPEQYRYDFKSAFTPVVALDRAEGEAIRVVGQVLDGAGQPINDALIEVVQADAAGRYVQSAEDIERTGFAGTGRCGTGTHAEHCFVFDTIKPGAAAPGEAPRIDVILTMRGLLNHLFTRIYFDDEAAANALDPVLQQVPAERRHTLIARREVSGGRVSYRFDIRMQGDEETVFLDL
ncbi:protocatechuate 3,4-dioxygenase subunit alpha [Pandoraea cepalis]|uniref:Protocatechuate 3,4-dioxygenase subunit alpha n=1 Tax=Pandoraea cepalis TaxID=2508294 RepID=A0AAW7MMH3_9BURK|nr:MULTISPECIES: protocatechuate 3,4-dioxygenase subunit alpha [Pandoraea]MDN4573846.1 protocatechuate 3,4-dioxygenase subunit alpha [Pandoraea cepalis]MDN4580382.1 protocatechuate 3,4-dioxygenase subunit alpha [Pandoraea cepalis]